MAILDNLVQKYFSKKQIQEKAVDDFRPSMTLNDFIINPHWKSNEFIREYRSWVYANATVIAEAESTINIRLYKYNSKDKSVDEVEEHEVLTLLHNPNPLQTQNEFFFNLSLNRSLTGESPIRLRRKNNNNPNEKPYQLWSVNPITMKVYVGKTADNFELITKYVLEEYNKGKAIKLELEPHEIVFMRNVNPNNPHRGIGVVEAAQTQIDTLHYSEAYNLNFFKNSAVPLTVLHTDQRLTKEVIERLRESWNQNYRGIDNAFKTAILEAGLKVEKLQASGKDMEFLEQQRYMRDSLMSMFRTTKVSLGLVEDVNRANAEASELVFMKNTIKPKMEKLVENLNQFLLPIFDKTGTLFFDFDDPVPQNRELMLTDYEKSVDKWRTKNEVRAMEGLEPLEGGDVIYQPLSEQPMGSKPEQMVQLSVKSKKDKTIPPRFEKRIRQLQNRLINNEQAILLAKELLKKMKRRSYEITNKNAPKYEGGVKNDKAVDRYIKQYLVTADKYEAMLKNLLASKLYQPMQAEALEAVTISKNINKKIFDTDKKLVVAYDLLSIVYPLAIKDAGSEAMELLNIDQTYDSLQTAKKYILKNARLVAKSIVKTIDDDISKILADSLDEGLGIDDIRQKIVDKFGYYKDSHATMIARTEIIKASNYASIDAWKQSGVVEGKEWLITRDDRLCEFCVAMNQKTQGLNDRFFKKGDTLTGVDGNVLQIDFSSIEHPPLHPNCRCAVIPIIKPTKSINVV